jgi:hypothetical protein
MWCSVITGGILILWTLFYSICASPSLPNPEQMVSHPPRDLHRSHVSLSGPVQDAFCGIHIHPPDTLLGHHPHTV